MVLDAERTEFLETGEELNEERHATTAAAAATSAASTANVYGYQYEQLVICSMIYLNEQ